MRTGFERASIGFDRTSPIPPYPPLRWKRLARAFLAGFRPRLRRRCARGRNPPDGLPMIHEAGRTSPKQSPPAPRRDVATSTSQAPRQADKPAFPQCQCRHVRMGSNPKGRVSGVKWSRSRPKHSHQAPAGRVFARVAASSFTKEVRKTRVWNTAHTRAGQRSSRRLSVCTWPAESRRCQRQRLSQTQCRHAAEMWTNDHVSLAFRPIDPMMANHVPTRWQHTEGHLRARCCRIFNSL
jgi:hypothetical protein